MRQLDAPETAAHTLAAMVALSTAGEAQGTRPLDIILVEGYRHSGLPTIELFRADNPKDAERELGSEGNEIIAVVTDMPRILESATEQGIPSFSFDAICALADFIEVLIKSA